MNKTRLINIEGIDCSGKTTIAKYLARKFKYKFQHEPRFSSQEADNLNFTGLDHYQREFYFMQDRIKHQTILNKYNVVLDSYILRGLTYTGYFGPKALPMVKSIYQLPIFKVPDIIIVIDIDPKQANKFNKKRLGKKNYNAKLNIDVLKGLNTFLHESIEEINSWSNHPPIIVIKNNGIDINILREQIIKRIVKYIPELGEKNEKKESRIK